MIDVKLAELGIPNESRYFGTSVSVSVLKNTVIEFPVSVFLSTDTDTEYMFSVLVFGIFTYIFLVKESSLFQCKFLP